ncbi:MAG: peptidoglycan DD-metalloendopeptidase family protein [Betaproteobacteria bacterium]
MSFRWMALAAAVLAGCTASRPAPVEDRRAARASVPAKPAPAPAVAAAPQDGFYTVKRGDTLYSIALEHGADYRELAHWNSLDDASKIKVGQVLRMQQAEARPTAAEVGRTRIVGRVEQRPLDSPAARAEPRPEPKAPAPAADAADFIWPVKGKVLTAFAEPRSKGIDIDGKPGDPVVAAAAGRVTYTGTGIAGLGKLVVIKHDSGFITVYAHNREVLVKEQQAVARGQKIAELGSTDAERPKLHFQIRRGAAAVDPLRYLPAL